MLKASTLKPDRRIKEIQDAVNQDVSLSYMFSLSPGPFANDAFQAFDYRSSPYLQDAEMTVDTRPMGINGRVINPPGIVYANQQAVCPIP